ncbi:ATP-dependent helicase [Erysipelotrichaceae bacterium RD49]|nr:ATP-dependent helicase [Erysipelotrichaceae bacterium RD49]
MVAYRHDYVGLDDGRHGHGFDALESRNESDSRSVFKSVCGKDDTTNTMIPTQLISWKTLLEFEDLIFDPKPLDKFLIAKTRICDYYLSIQLQNLEIIETADKIDPNKTALSLDREYQVTLIRSIRGLDNSQFSRYSCIAGDFYIDPDNTIQVMYTDCPEGVFDHFIQQVHHYEKDVDIFEDETRNWIQSQTDYKLACKASKKWQYECVETFQFVFNCWNYHYNVAGYILPDKTEALTDMFSQMAARLEFCTLSLDQYSKLFEFLHAHEADMNMHQVVSQNLFLLLHSTIEDLCAAKGSLTVPPLVPAGKTPKDFYASNSFSTQQQAIIESSEPLVLCQSGAGTGKSTVVKERISYLCRLGVLPADIMVLSFTNGAADHIRQLNDRVMSKTIARMIHDLYQHNFPNHNLSTISSLANAIEICFPDDPCSAPFIHLLKEVMNNRSGALSRLNVFVENNSATVKTMLDTAQMTCLELEQILCCQNLYQLNEPIDLAAKFIIVDEVQDTSIYEFIFLLKYTCKNDASMMMIGDCSQTLFEFRFSNPRIMNTLEASSTFALYKLTTNYRSSPEILSMANILLQNISANQFANIQLVSNSLAQITRDSFKEKVQTWYSSCYAREYREKFMTDFPLAVHQYIQDKLARNEKIAIAAPRRVELKWVEDCLKRIVPKAGVVNLCPQRFYPSSLLTDFIREHWSSVSRAAGTSLIQTIADLIRGTFASKSPKTVQYRSNFIDCWQKNRSFYFQSLEQACDSGQISLDQCLDLMRKDMMAYEAAWNMAKQSRISRANEKLKNKKNVHNADIVLSTIHSIKGLEFDNVILIADNGRFSDEADKRMYYVGLTRAMKSELIYVHGTEKVSVVDAIHQQIVNSL